MGLGYFGSDAYNNPERSGVMADVAASANDPIFLNHHAIVDCIFETWLQRNPNAQYPVSNEIPKGHRKEDYIVPFFPLYKHSDMFSTAENYGYHCIIKPVPKFNKPSKSESDQLLVIILNAIIGVVGGISCTLASCILGHLACKACCYSNDKKSRNKLSTPKHTDTTYKDI